MWKSVLAGTAALAITGATLAYAQHSYDGARHMRHWRPNGADITAFAGARIAALHAGLQLNAEQEKKWPAMESAMRNLAKQRSDCFAHAAGSTNREGRSSAWPRGHRNWKAAELH